MKTAKRKVTLMLDSDVYDGLRKMLGERNIGKGVSKMVRPYIDLNIIELGYKELASDKDRDDEGEDWIAVDEEMVAENVWRI